MSTFKYIALFILIQLVNIPLALAGLFVCLSPALAHDTWLWWNTDDAALIDAMPSWLDKYNYLALRNPVANLRHVWGVSKIGRPLFYRTWFSFTKQFYVKAGWMSDGYPALSAGAGKGF